MNPQREEGEREEGGTEQLPNSRTRGREALHLNIAAATLVSDMVRTTLGPRGMDKLIVNSSSVHSKDDALTVTNDGATILRELRLDHPIAQLLRNLAQTQESEVGDGTTTAVVLAGELLRKAEPLLDSLHPTTLIKGYQQAAAKAVRLLEGLARPLKKELLVRVAMTAMTGKGVAQERLARLVVEAAQQAEPEEIRIIHSSGQESETRLIHGVVLEKERIHPRMPTRVEGKVLLLDAPLEVRNTDTAARITIDEPEKLQGFLEAEEQILKKLTEKVLASGATILCSQRGIDDAVAASLAKAGVLAVRRVSRSELELLARVTGATIVSNLDELGLDGTNQSRMLGEAVAEEQLLDGEPLLFLTSKKTKAVTLLLAGATGQSTLEAERALEDAIGVVASALRSKKLLPGAGAPELELAVRLRKEAPEEAKEAFEAFASALEVIPLTLAENAGLPPEKTVAALRAAHERGEREVGVDVMSGAPVDAWRAGILEPLESAVQAVTGATEVANLILRIDDVIVNEKQ